MGRHGENIRKRSDGRWEARYTAYDEKRGGKISRSVYGHTYQEAKEKRAAALVGLTAQLTVGNTVGQQKMMHNISFGMAAEKWLGTVKSERKPSTFEKYSFIYHGYLEKKLDTVSLEQLTESFLMDKLAALEELSVSLRKSIYCVLNGILRYVSKQYNIALPKIKLETFIKYHKKAEVYTKSEQTKLLAALCTNMDRFKLAVLLCLFTGLRLGELCALKWEDIDFTNKTLTIKRTVQRLYAENGRAKTTLVETTPKSSHSKREIPLQEAIVMLLEDYRNEKEYVFGGDKPLEPRTMQNRYKKILQEAGITYKNFHTLRHTYATNCIEDGTDVKSLSEMLGHSNVKITLNYYVHPSMDTKRIYADNLCKFYVRLGGQVLGRTG